MSWISKIKTPAYVIDEAKLIRNLEILRGLEHRTGCKVLLAQKAFSTFALYPLIAEYISGTTASGLYEARLAFEEMPQRENHVFSPAYTQNDFRELLKICSHIVFNSHEQWSKYKKSVPDHISCGLRINPEYSTGEHAIYDPCAPHSRLGATLESLKGRDLIGIEGLHFHTLCQQNSDALKATLDVVIEKFGGLFPNLKWVNMGGGHHITREDYDLPLLEHCIAKAQELAPTVYVEPGEAVALNAGMLVSEVVSIVNNNMNIAILDCSAACHMPDVLEMPYRPEIIGADIVVENDYGRDKGTPRRVASENLDWIHSNLNLNNNRIGEKKHNVRLAGNTCLAGDIIGDYSFDSPLREGDRVVFTDMAIYTMVKNNTFNGMPLPSIAILRRDDSIETVKEFGYDDFKQRLS